MDTLFRSPFQKLSITLFLCFALWTVFLTVSGLRTTLANTIYNVAVSGVYLFGAVVAAGGMMKVTVKSTIGKMLGFTSLALLMNGIANLVWSYYTIVLSIPTPYPSWADLFFILYYPTIAISFVLLLVIFQTSMTYRLMWETIGFAILSAAIILFFLRPDIALTRDMTLASILDILYPIGDILLLTLALLGFRVAGEKIKTVLYFFIGSLTVDVIADIVFSIMTNANTYFNGNISDTLFVTSALLLVLGTKEITSQFGETG